MVMEVGRSSGRYPWGDETPLSKMLKENSNFKVTKIVETKEGLKVEAKKEYDVNKVLKLLEECINYEKTYSYEILYPSYTLNTYVTLDSILNDVKGCIEQLATKLDGATQYNNALLNSRKAHLNYINKLSKKASKLEDDNDHLKYEVDALVGQNQALSDENKKLEAKNAVLSDSNNRLNRVTEEALRENQALRKKLEASEKENEELAEKLRQSNETVEERVKDLLRTRVENEYLKNRLKYEIGMAFDNDIKASEDENGELNRKVKELQEKLQRVITENDHLKYQISDMIAQHQALVEENEELKERLKAASDAINDLLKNAPARNCINCDRYDVCMTVAERKARKANNYKPCTIWKKADEK